MKQIPAIVLSILLLTAACDPVAPDKQRIVIQPALEVLDWSPTPRSAGEGLFVYGQLEATEEVLELSQILSVDVRTSGGDVENIFLRKEVCRGETICYGVSIRTRNGVSVSDSSFVSRLSSIGGVVRSTANSGQLGTYHTTIRGEAAADVAAEWPGVAEAYVARYFSLADWVREQHFVTGAIKAGESPARPRDGSLQVDSGETVELTYSDSLGNLTEVTLTWE